MEHDEVRKQWHGPFFSAMCLEFVEDKEGLDFQNEYTLSTKPLQIDLLIVKKAENISIRNQIGEIFRGHNLLEYKSPGAELGIDTYYKVLGYACFYKSLGKQADAIRADDITISLIREGYPRELMRYFADHGFGIEQKYPGIYYVSKGVFPIQVIETRKLDPKLHIWLTSLTRNLTASNAEYLVYQITQMKEKEDQINASAVLNLAIDANPDIFQKEGNEMFESLERIMQPHTDKIVHEAVEKAVEKAVEEAVQETTRKTARETTSAVKRDDVDSIITKLQISLEKACEVIGITVDEYNQAKKA